MPDEEEAAIFGRLEFIRHQHGWSIAEMARRAGLPKRSMENYFKGHKPGYDALIAMSKAFTVPVDWLCGFSDLSHSDTESMVYDAAYPTIFRALRFMGRLSDEGKTVFADGKVFGRPLDAEAAEQAKSVVQRFASIAGQYPGGFPREK